MVTIISAKNFVIAIKLPSKNKIKQKSKSNNDCDSILHCWKEIPYKFTLLTYRSNYRRLTGLFWSQIHESVHESPLAAGFN